MLVVLLHRRRWLCAAAQVIPYAVLAAGVGIFCALNQYWYGVWGLSDSARALLPMRWVP